MSCLVEQVAGCSFTIMKTFSEWLISLEDERLEIGDWRLEDGLAGDLAYIWYSYLSTCPYRRRLAKQTVIRTLKTQAGMVRIAFLVVSSLRTS